MWLVRGANADWQNVAILATRSEIPSCVLAQPIQDTRRGRPGAGILACVCVGAVFTCPRAASQIRRLAATRPAASRRRILRVRQLKCQRGRVRPRSVQRRT